jgi:hypothetical protein
MDSTAATANTGAGPDEADAAVPVAKATAIDVRSGMTAGVTCWGFITRASRGMS